MYYTLGVNYLGLRVYSMNLGETQPGTFCECLYCAGSQHGDIFYCHDQRDGVADGIQWVEARDAAKHLTQTPPSTPRQRSTWPKMSIVPKLRNPA